VLPEVSAEFAIPEPPPAPELPSREPPAAGPPGPGHGEPQAPTEDASWLAGAFLTAAPGSPARASLLARLVAHPAAAPVLSELLPGPLEVAPAALAATPAALQGPVLEALAAIGQPAVPHLLAVLGDAQPARRRAATALLGAIGDPATLVPLADRCLDPDLAVAEAAREALAAHRGTPAMRPVPERLRRALASGLATRAGPAALALMALRDAESIPNLIQALEGTDPVTAAAPSAGIAGSWITTPLLSPENRATGWASCSARARATCDRNRPITVPMNEAPATRANVRPRPSSRSHLRTRLCQPGWRARSAVFQRRHYRGHYNRTVALFRPPGHRAKFRLFPLLKMGNKQMNGFQSMVHRADIKL
jgi:hypothetical protein